VSYSYITPPRPITKEERARILAELENAPEREIDTSDIPEVKDEEWVNFVPYAEAVAALKREKAEKKKQLKAASN